MSVPARTVVLMSEDTTPELGVLAVEALDLLTAAVRDVPADRWDDPSILQDWTVRELVAHATGSATRMRFPRKRGGIDNRGRDARETQEVRPGVP